MAQKNPNIDNNDMFVKLALEKLLNEKDIKKSQYQQLKRACETALGLFYFLIIYSTKKKLPFFSVSVTKDPQTTSIYETYFLPFELACTSKHPRMVDTALDCLQVNTFEIEIFIYFIFLETSFTWTFNWEYCRSSRSDKILNRSNCFNNLFMFSWCTNTRKS